MRHLVYKCLTIGVSLTLATPFAYGVGPIMEGMEISWGDLGPNILRISNGLPGGGISHSLNPDDWYQFRIKVSHSDSKEQVFVSDGFTPTSDNIQLCSVGGCEALPIDLGIDNLDWEDESKVQIILQGKVCMLCEWVDHEVTPLK